jgi:ATP-binding protein involved in chromosome partitioning
MPSDLDIASITVDRESHIEVTYTDDKVCRFELIELRQACPCAACRTARERGEASWPPRGSTVTELAITDAHLVGAYGLGVLWSDGHSTGIYPFDALRRWCDAGRPEAGI